MDRLALAAVVAAVAGLRQPPGARAHTAAALVVERAVERAVEHAVERTKRRMLVAVVESAGEPEGAEVLAAGRRPDSRKHQAEVQLAVGGRKGYTAELEPAAGAHHTGTSDRQTDRSGVWAAAGSGSGERLVVAVPVRSSVAVAMTIADCRWSSCLRGLGGSADVDLADRLCRRVDRGRTLLGLVRGHHVLSLDRLDLLYRRLFLVPSRHVLHHHRARGLFRDRRMAAVAAVEHRLT